jgi:hypothetical protein
MAEIISYPDRNNANMNQWRVMIEGLEHYAKDLLLLNVGNIDTNAAPTINAGSIFIVNGSVYKCTANEIIGGTAVDNKQNYVYAIPAPEGTTVSFSYMTTGTNVPEPAWDAAKGGWYNGNNRALVRFFRSDSQYNNKIILDNYNAKNAVNTKQPFESVSQSGGALVFGYTSPLDTYVNLPSGIYRAEVKDGKGGLGGQGGSPGAASNGAASGSAGNPGADGIGGTIRSFAFLHHGSPVRVIVGNDGGNGGAGGRGGNGSNIVNTTQGRAGKGGNGGDGGDGGKSFIGCIVSTDDSLISVAAQNGKDGSSGLPGTNVSPYGDTSSNTTGMTGGSAGGAALATSSGYARLWRIG